MLDEIHIGGYKSIKVATISLNKLNVIIGANGVGKSNFLSIFKFLNELLNKRLRKHVNKVGADSILYFGKKETSELLLAFYVNDFLYKIILTSNFKDELLLEEESILFGGGKNFINKYAEHESRIFNYTNVTIPDQEQRNALFKAINSFTYYHFNDTSDTSKIKGFSHIDDNEFLREDGSNLAAFLYWIEVKHYYNFQQITKAIQRVAPFFDRFKLNPDRLRDNQIKLEWQEKTSDHYFDAHSLSDGTLRMICLATALLQPNPPNTIIIDEPELGLHPSAITILIALIHKAIANGTQVIIATQSPTVLNHFSPEDIIVVNRKSNQSTFERLNNEDLETWLEDYTMGEIWEKNLVGGRP